MAECYQEIPRFKEQVSKQSTIRKNEGAITQGVEAMNEQHKLYVKMTNALHRWLNNHHNDEADYQRFKDKANDYKEFMKNE